MWERRSSPGLNERLSARRRRGERRALVVLGICALMLFGAFIWLTWQPYVRITHVQISDGDSAILALTMKQLEGTNGFIIPRDSFFFVPGQAIRSAILEAHPEIQAVSIARNGFIGLTLNIIPRVAIASWCGPTPDASQGCYFFDANGYVFESTDSASTTPINSFIVYEPHAGTTQDPLRATLANASKLPAVFDFAREVGTFGSPASSVTLRGDEVDVVLQSGTRLTYVLGDERQAFSDLSYAKVDLNLADGSLDYVDLRFAGKVYVKKKDSSTSQAVSGSVQG